MRDDDRSGESREVEALLRVFQDHPWLVDSLMNADWWEEDGQVLFSTQLDDIEHQRAGVEAFARAIGMELRNDPPADGAAVDLPSDPPLRLPELMRRLRS